MLDMEWILQGLDTNRPEIIFKGGHSWTGEYEETFGSQLFLEEGPIGSASGTEKSSINMPVILGISERSIRFKDTVKIPKVPTILQQPLK